MEYSKHIKFFEQLQEEGKPTPLDFREELDPLDNWYRRAYISLSNGANGYNRQISLQDKIFYFEYYDSPYPIDISVFIIDDIESRLQEYSRKKEEAQSKNIKFKK